MSKQPEALRLANELEDAAGDYFEWNKHLGYNAAAELRRLHAVNAGLLEALRVIQDMYPSEFESSRVARAAIAAAKGEA